MARHQVKDRRVETWGVLRYDKLRHSFSYSEKESRLGEPYASEPVVLNIVITRRCNMDCDYCVAKDFTGIEKEDLVLSTEMIKWIKNSSFMLLVLTGGEPLMPPYNLVTKRLVDSINDRGIIIDTNGTILPDREMLSLLKRNRVMLRVSMDSMNPKEEIERRRMPMRKGLDSIAAYYTKLTNIERFHSAGINTAVQTVVWRKNEESLYQMIDWLSAHGIKRWYLQRLIPSNRFKKPSTRFTLKSENYYPLVTKIADRARSAGIECVPKMDLRHNSVFLLTADGALYTQGAAPGQKVRLGTIREDINYFDYVSAADHACRYYLVDSPPEESGRPGNKVAVHGVKHKLKK